MKTARAITAPDRNACFAIRRAVFIDEQAIPEAEEWDAHDQTCIHYLMRDDDTPAGTARLIALGATAKIGRVAILPAYRGKGFGHGIMRHILKDARAMGFAQAELDAQITALPFYEKLGFQAQGPLFDDGSGLMHRNMHRPF
jgi:predicted GNAT family N-acyltransferase